ncbi:hypothetical protein DEO72_LG2g2920 [Vigna unguiculata]|uniref:Aminotransferase-like n=1 Tax=Vigna unguiculata TaxID=3917 RepID=A0A4D6L277_VIGUN|nr:hypothetical protein DEO72_LG2g2920 [Vigna unguiculata]
MYWIRTIIRSVVKDEWIERFKNSSPLSDDTIQTQEDSWECGYCVMYWIRTIIRSVVKDEWIERFKNSSPLSDDTIQTLPAPFNERKGEFLICVGFSVMARKGKKDGKKPDVDEKDRVRLINFVDTKHIVEINNVLTDGHWRRIGVTPFKWCLELERSLDICIPLLVELLQRWDDGEQSFHIWKHLVPLSVVDFCFSLGLGVVGEEVQFDAYGCGNSKVICNMPFRILDDIDSLVKFNWGSAVHSFLVNSLSRAYGVHSQKKNDHNITLPGSVVVLQVH